ncbi:hypothetical protein Y88_1283 [Novosphingobium nitrogenifigens DSM 19370]|uniref:Uncharacterized protein n=1 Tax=Novosphingobium nitrogenifigens DSM 19370 TaxID=983920 RepID=F1Z804_9SPHN|nr:hypothetical protein Y88_1283 [Novosphingobium nitrogenifigens DSM 19370]
MIPAQAWRCRRCPCPAPRTPDRVRPEIVFSSPWCRPANRLVCGSETGQHDVHHDCIRPYLRIGPVHSG